MCLVLSPPCTLKSGESEPGLEPRCPVHLPLAEVQADSRTGDTISPGFPEVLLQDSFAIYPGHVLGHGFVRISPRCPHAVVSSGRKRKQAGRQAGSCSALRQIPRPSAHRPGCSVRLAPTETSVALVEAAPLCPECPRGLRGAELPLHPGRSSAPVGSGKHALQRGLY